MQTISLKEALTGCNFVLEHLDGRRLNVRSHPREVIKPGDLKVRRCALVLGSLMLIVGRARGDRPFATRACRCRGVP